MGPDELSGQANYAMAYPAPIAVSGNPNELGKMTVYTLECRVR